MGLGCAVSLLLSPWLSPLSAEHPTSSTEHMRPKPGPRPYGATTWLFWLGVPLLRPWTSFVLPFSTLLSQF